jgi:hypothetical protein
VSDRRAIARRKEPLTIGVLEETLARLTFFYRSGGGGTVCRADASQLADVFGSALECFQMACHLPERDANEIVGPVPRKISPRRS